jgi:hypothetical protein
MKRAFVAITVTMVAMMGSAQAAPTTFTFGASENNQTSILKSLDGINLTIGNFSNPGPNSFADGDGLGLITGTNFANKYKTLDMTFDQPVKLISYNIGYLQLAGSTTTTYSQNMLQSVQTYTTGKGLKLFNNQFIAQANTPISVVSVNTNPALNGPVAVQINALTVEKVDPVPLPLAGAAAAFSWSRGLRGRIRRTARV